MEYNNRNHSDGLGGPSLNEESEPLSSSPVRGGTGSRSRSGSPTRPHTHKKERVVERIEASSKKKQRSCCSSLLRCLTKTLLQPCFLLQRTLGSCGDHPSKWGFLFGLLIMTDFFSSLLTGFVVDWSITPPEVGVFIGVGIPIGLFVLLYWAIVKRFLVGARDPLSIWPSTRFCTFCIGSIAAVFGFFFAFLLVMNRGVEALQLASANPPLVECGLTDSQNTELLSVSEATHSWLSIDLAHFQVNAGSVRTYATDSALGGNTVTPEWEAVCLAEMVMNGTNCPDVHVLLTWVLTASALDGVVETLQEAFDQNVCEADFTSTAEATFEKHLEIDGKTTIRLIDDRTQFITSYQAHTYNSVERGVETYALASSANQSLDGAVVLPLDFKGMSIDELETKRTGLLLGFNALQGVHFVMWILSVPLLYICKRCCRLRLLSEIV